MIGEEVNETTQATTEKTVRGTAVANDAGRVPGRGDFESIVRTGNSVYQ
jgi:hypothetical protein